MVEVPHARHDPGFLFPVGGIQEILEENLPNSGVRVQGPPDELETGSPVRVLDALGLLLPDRLPPIHLSDG